MPKTLLDFANACGRYPAIHRGAQTLALKAATEATKVGITHSAQQKGWPTKGSGMGPIGLTSRLLGTEAATVTAKGGAAYAFEYGAKRHVIVPKKKKVLRTPYGPRAYVSHPGFRGRPFFDGGLRLAEPAVIKAMEAAVVNAMRRTFS